MFVIELVIGWVVEGELCVLFVFDGLEGEWLDVVFVWLFGVLCICVVDFVVEGCVLLDGLGIVKFDCVSVGVWLEVCLLVVCLVVVVVVELVEGLLWMVKELCVVCDELESDV